MTKPATHTHKAQYMDEKLEQRLAAHYSDARPLSNAAQDRILARVLADVVAHPRPGTWSEPGTPSKQFLIKLWGGISSATAAALCAGFLSIGTVSAEPAATQWGESDLENQAVTWVYGPDYVDTGMQTTNEVGVQ